MGERQAATTETSESRDEEASNEGSESVVESGSETGVKHCPASWGGERGRWVV